MLSKNILSTKRNQLTLMKSNLKKKQKAAFHLIKNLLKTSITRQSYFCDNFKRFKNEAESKQKHSKLAFIEL